MRAVVSVIGKDMVGILAKVAGECASCGANIVDVTQTVLQDLFVMIMLVELGHTEDSFSELRKKMSLIEGEMGLSIHVMHEDIFNSMHKI
ncbi:MAG: ACT domain-containing protein [Lachnospiraceae bacterium]|nr:ACT domain-containing protein [Lachnospiraceae bacterium]